MIEKHQRLALWAGVGFAPLLAIALLTAGWVPPPSPSMSADAVREMYAEDRTRIRVGIWIATAAAPLLAFYGAAISHQCKRILGPTPLASAQSLAAACLILEFIFPQIIWQVAAYRGERSAADIQMLNDIGWILYMGVVGTAIVQMVVCAVCILQDPRDLPLIPRWAAYVCLWSAGGVTGGGLCVFTQTGPLAWNGLIAWWLLVVAFFVWFITMITLMHRASTRIEAEDLDAHLDAAETLTT